MNEFQPKMNKSIKKLLVLSKTYYYEGIILNRNLRFSLKALLISTFLLVAPPSLAWEAGTPDYRAQSFTIHLVQNPQGLDEIFVDLMSSENGQVIATAAATYYGIPKKAVVAAATVSKAIKSNRKSEARYLSFPFPEGFSPCKIRIVRESLNGPGHITLRLYPDKIGAYVALKRNNILDGSRTWAKVKIEVLSLYWRDYRDTGNGQHAARNGTCDHYVHGDMKEEDTKYILNQAF